MLICMIKIPNIFYENHQLKRNSSISMNLGIN